MVNFITGATIRKTSATSRRLISTNCVPPSPVNRIGGEPELAVAPSWRLRLL